MPSLHKHIQPILCALVAVIFFWPGLASALVINEMRFGEHPDKTRMVLDLSEEVNYRVFALSDPYRIIIDLPDFTWKVGSIYKPDSSGIAGIRQGKLEAGISRIVLDMKAPVTVGAAFVLPGDSSKPSRLVVDFSPAAASNPPMQVYGMLTGGGMSAHNPSTLPTRPPADNVDNISMEDPAVIAALGTAPAAGPMAVPAPARKPDKKSPPQADTQKTEPPYKKPLIIIDPGHGGEDPGAIGKHKTREKDVVLALAKELKKQLEATGQFDVLLTRDSDKFIRLRDRVNFARKHQGDLFVSIHADSIDKSSVRGSSIYTLSEKASDAQTAKLADSENRADLIAGLDLSNEDKDVANILVDLAMRDTMNQSNFFANKLVEKLNDQSGVRTLPNAHRFAGFAVLKAPDIPSVLIEAGFMSNAEEERLLTSAEHRRKVASAIRYGITAYFEHVRRNERS